MQKNDNDIARPFRYTVKPHIHSCLVLHTLPNAVCRIRPETPGDPQEEFKVLADAKGTVRIHVRPLGESPGVIRLAMHADAEGKSALYMIELRCAFEPTDDMPMPVDEPLEPVPEGRIQPALSREQMTNLTDAQLHKEGYPLRPDHERMPRAFREWQRVVSVPMVKIEPHSVANPFRTHAPSGVEEGPSSTSIWSGFVLPREQRVSPVRDVITVGDPYDWVTGTWTVPPVQGELNKTAHSSVWVGIDGFSYGRFLNTVLVQAGVDGSGIVYQFPGLFTTLVVLSTYYAWTEFLPQQPTSQVITNFPANPGDQIRTDVWIGNAGEAPSLSGAFGVFLVMNLTANVSAMMYTPVGSTVVRGAEAEWVVERPSRYFAPSGIFGAYTVPYDLANYGSVVISNALARKANSPGYQGYVPYSSPGSLQLAMINRSTGNTLSNVTPLDAYSMRFDWKAFN